VLEGGSLGPIWTVHGNLEVLDERDKVIRVVARYVGVIVAATDCVDGCCLEIGLPVDSLSKRKLRRSNSFPISSPEMATTTQLTLLNSDAYYPPRILRSPSFISLEK